MLTLQDKSNTMADISLRLIIDELFLCHKLNHPFQNNAYSGRYDDGLDCLSIDTAVRIWSNVLCKAYM